jgi:hypothetical protein
MSFVERNKGIYENGLKRIAKVFKGSRKAQGLNMVDSLLEKLRSHMSDDMILEGLLDNLFEEEAVSILSDLARFEGLSVEASRRKGQEGEALSLGTGTLDEMMSSIQSELESFISSLPPEEQDKALQMADQQMQNFLSEFFSGAHLASRKRRRAKLYRVYEAVENAGGGVEGVGAGWEEIEANSAREFWGSGWEDADPSTVIVATDDEGDSAHFRPFVDGVSASRKRRRRRSQEESSGEMLSAADEYALDMSLLDSLMSWHSGQGSDIYALGSSLFAGNDVPKEIAEGALFELESSLEGLDPSSPEYDELATLVDALSYWISPF